MASGRLKRETKKVRFHFWSLIGHGRQSMASGRLKRETNAIFDILDPKNIYFDIHDAKKVRFHF